MFQGASTWHWFKTRHDSDSDRGTPRPYPKWAYILRHDRAKKGWIRRSWTSIDPKVPNCFILSWENVPWSSIAKTRQQNNRGRKKKCGKQVSSGSGSGSYGGAGRWGESVMMLQYRTEYLQYGRDEMSFACINRPITVLQHQVSCLLIPNIHDITLTLTLTPLAVESIDRQTSMRSTCKLQPWNYPQTYLLRIGDEVGHRYTITLSLIVLHLKSSQKLTNYLVARCNPMDALLTTRLWIQMYINIT